MHESLAVLPVDRFYRRLSQRGRITVCQLPLSAAMVLAAAAVAWLSPETLQHRPFQASLILHLIILGLCLVLPWTRLPRGSFIIIPLLDFLAIGFSRETGSTALTIMGLLYVLPVVWLSIVLRKTGIAVSILGTILSAVLTPLLLNGELPPPSLIRPVLLTVTMGAIAFSVHLIARTALRQKAQLERQDSELQALLNAASKRERLLGTIVETVGIGIWAIDETGSDILINRRQKTHLIPTVPRDRNPAQSETLMPAYESDRTTPIPQAEHPVHKAISGQPVTDQQIWTGTGSNQLALSVTARTMENESGEFTGSVIAFTDVTRLTSALAAKDAFLSNISHELRTPLTSVLGYIDLVIAEKDTLSSPMLRHLTVAQRNAEHLLNLVADLLAVASDAIQITKRPTDLRDVIAFSVESARPTAAASGIDLILDSAGPLTAHADPMRIGQVLDNLLSNAIKYSPDSGTVTIRTRTTPHGIVCEVSDTGIGMNNDEQEQVFTKFFRSPQAQRSAIPGVGLGLLITKTIIENHDGTITLHSAPGTGTTVTFTLPTTDEHNEPAMADPPTTNTEPGLATQT